MYRDLITMEACWTLILLMTLGATAVCGKYTISITNELQDNRTVVLTCTYKRNGERALSRDHIAVLWFRRGGMKSLGDPDGFKLAKNSATSTLLIPQRKLIGAVYFCVVKDWVLSDGISSPEMWVLNATLIDTTTTSTEQGATTPYPITKPYKDTPIATSTTVSTTSCPCSVMSDPIVQAVIFSMIFILVATVIVLTVFIIRMKRNVDGKTPKGGRQHDEFDEYALPVGASKSDDLYRSLGKAQRIQAQMNAAFEPEGSNYNDVFWKVGRPAGSDPQGRLEDGYKGDGTTDTPVYQVLDPDAPVYQVLDPDAEANEYEEALAANGTGATGEGQPPQRGSNLAGVFAKKRGEGINDYSHVHAKPPHQKAKGGSEMAAECSPGNADDDYSHISRTPMPDEQDDVYSHVNRPRVTGRSDTEEAAEDNYSQPYGKAKMAAKGWQGNDGDDYNRLELPSLANPSSLAGMQKEGKTAATSGTSHPAPGGRVAADDENDYEKACNVVQ